MIKGIFNVKCQYGFLKFLLKKNPIISKSGPICINLDHFSLTATSAATSTTPATTSTTTTPSSTALMSKALSGFGGSNKKSNPLAAAIIANAAAESKQEQTAQPAQPAQNQQTAVNNSRATPVNAANPGSAGTTSSSFFLKDKKQNQIKSKSSFFLPFSYFSHLKKIFITFNLFYFFLFNLTAIDLLIRSELP